MPTIYRPPPPPPPPPSKLPAIALCVVIGLAFIGATIWIFYPGHLATKQELAGHWVHEGDNITVEVDFQSNGHFDRYPKDAKLGTNATGEPFPIQGGWHLSDKGQLDIDSGGSFRPYLN